MEDEQNSVFGMGGKRFYSDDEPQRPAEDKQPTDEYEVSLDEVNDENDDDLGEVQEEDPLDRLTSNEEL